MLENVGVYAGHPVWIQSIGFTSCKCRKHVRIISLTCLLRVPNISQTYHLYVPNLSLSNILYVPYMSLTWPLHLPLILLYLFDMSVYFWSLVAQVWILACLVYSQKPNNAATTYHVSVNYMHNKWIKWWPRYCYTSYLKFHWICLLWTE